MSNIIILPILIPALTGVLLVLFVKKQTIQRFISGFSMLATLLATIYLGIYIYNNNGIAILELGNWPAPFGIVLVADFLAVLVVVLSSVVGVCCLFFAFQTLHPEREKHYFYTFFFFLLTGVNGSALTGDLFNLFVFFEVMLFSSYALVVMGGTKFQLRESFKYMVINVFASMLFLVGIAYLYGITGTMNMAHLAVRIKEVGQTGALHAVAMIFFIVFAMKGALFPLYFWLPRSYYGPPTAITALFAGVLTKVGIYAIIRTFTLIFVHDIVFTHYILLLIIASLTMLVGVLGAVSQFNFKMILSYHTISQLGYMIMGIGIFTTISLAGTIYFFAHHAVVKTALFLFAGVTKKITGTNDLERMGGVLRTHPFLGWMFFISALSIAGIPPLSGFFGKFSLIVSSLTGGNYLSAFMAIFVGLLTLFSMLKIFVNVFWGEQKHTAEQTQTPILGVMMPILPLVVLTIVMGIGAQWFFGYALATSEQLLESTIYIDAVLRSR